jgi:ABC-type multidrug transport system ATPase subunit
MVTHNLELIVDCHRVARISDGRILMTYEVPKERDEVKKLIRRINRHSTLASHAKANVYQYIYYIC